MTDQTRELVERVRWLVADLEEAMVQLTARLSAAETQRDDAIRDLVDFRQRVDDYLPGGIPRR